MIFFGGLFMVALALGVFVAVCNATTEELTWLEDACAGMMMMGLGIMIIGAVAWVGRMIG